jgi:hypothetical protein
MGELAIPPEEGANKVTQIHEGIRENAPVYMSVSLCQPLQPYSKNSENG